MSKQATFEAFSPNPEPLQAGRPLDPETGCPWCLAPPEAFRESADGGTGCGLCDAALPVDAPWFKAGEKIIDLASASRLYQGYWTEKFA